MHKHPMKIRSNYSAPTFGLVISLILASVQPAQALILGRKGNKPVKNVGWPTDSEKMANIPTRIAWWEGPPFGGGNYHFEYRAKDTAQFNLALKVFSQIKAPKLRLVVRDDTYKSFWLRNEKDPRLDWEFVVWIPRNWHSLYNTPGSVTFSDHPDFRKPVPPPTINLHLGGSAIEWDKVVMPANITVLDERETAPARARARQNGGVVQGFVYDFATGQVIQDARVSLRWERKPKGGTKLLAVTQVDYSGDRCRRRSSISRNPGRCPVR